MDWWTRALNMVYVVFLHFQHGRASLACECGLRPRYVLLPKQCEAGGIGGSVRPFGIPAMPMGIA
eukprot:9120357-Karenia_brevis.AAC.1